ncbi:MAG: hypothetical protein WDM84_03115 [Bauldia sp.]
MLLLDEPLSALDAQIPPHHGGRTRPPASRPAKPDRALRNPTISRKR